MITAMKTNNPTIQLRKTSITDVPPELLSVIFKFVHDDSIPIQQEKDIIPTWMRIKGLEGFKESVTALTNPASPDAPRLKSPTLFPYSLAAVCGFWRDVLSSHPEFWTSVVLFVDSKATPLLDVSLFLEWSREHLIDVFITRREELRPTFHPDRHEKCQINAFLHMLKPHLHRCRSLHVDAHLSSSFPMVHQIFSKIEAPFLTSMEFVCEAHADEEYDLDEDFDAFSPELTRLVIDGKNFCYPYEDSNYWMERRGLKQLTVAQYKSGDYGDLHDFLNFIDSFYHLEQLKFEGLHFPIFPDNLDFTFAMPFIHFEDVSDTFIADIFKFVYFECLSVLRITRCALPNIYDIMGVPDLLFLEDIGASVDLLGAVTDWQGDDLWLDRCHSFSDQFLNALGRLLLPKEEFPCHSMSRLLLCRLPNFSILCLKKMIEKRNEINVDYDDPDWKTATSFGPAISHLAVVQCGLGDLSVEDETWFREHLVEFSWVP